MDWGKIGGVLQILVDAPERWAVEGRVRPHESPTRSELLRALEVVRRGLLDLGPGVALPSADGLPSDVDDMILELTEQFLDLRTIELARLRRAVEGLGSRLEDGSAEAASDPVAFSGVWLRTRLGMLAMDAISSAPGSYLADEEGLRETALAWLLDNALLLEDGERAACLRSMSRCHGLGAVPLAKMLYRQAPEGSRVRRAVEEVFPESLD